MEPDMLENLLRHQESMWAHLPPSEVVTVLAKMAETKTLLDAVKELQDRIRTNLRAVAGIMGLGTEL